tara:strand:+ start:16014 stop:16664 length:651 start_codon:yes stop_codon:yes gene_type:complete
METIISTTEDFVKQQLAGDSSGHDWWHIHRVRNLALSIAKQENADLFIVEMAALLHDVGDPKMHGGDTTVAPRLIGNLLSTINLTKQQKEHIMHIIAHMSFGKHLKGEEVQKSIEFQIVQDADRLDAMGAVGIARTFAFGGSKGRLMYHPDIKPNKNLTSEAYHKAEDPTINHFYEKLLKLKDLMNTETAKEIAQDRHEYMEQFLEHFYAEWDGHK